MKVFRVLLIVVAVGVFLGTGMYMLYDYLVSDFRDEQNMGRVQQQVRQMVEQSEDAAEEDALPPPRMPTAKVTVARQITVDPGGQTEKTATDASGGMTATNVSAGESSGQTAQDTSGGMAAQNVSAGQASGQTAQDTSGGATAPNVSAGQTGGQAAQDTSGGATAQNVLAGQASGQTASDTSGGATTPNVLAGQTSGQYAPDTTGGTTTPNVSAGQTSGQAAPDTSGDATAPNVQTAPDTSGDTTAPNVQTGQTAPDTSGGTTAQNVPGVPHAQTGNTQAGEDTEMQPTDGVPTEPTEPVLSLMNDAEGLAESVQGYLQGKITAANQEIDIIRLEISPMAMSAGSTRKPEANVRVTIYGHVGSSATKQTLENGIARVSEQHIADDLAWTVQNEIIDFNVQIEIAPILPQYEPLFAQNRDMIGWIRIEGTKVNYPVMQTFNDPEFYLRRNFEKEDSYSGVPFMDARSDVNRPLDNLLVYGHNMKSGTMFGQLPLYESRDFWRNHQRVHFDLLNEQRVYEVVGMFRSRQYKEDEPGFHYYDYIDLSEMTRFNDFITQVKKASLIDTGVTPTWGDQILTLSTCSYHADDGTFVVVAKRVWEEAGEDA